MFAHSSRQNCSSFTFSAGLWSAFWLGHSETLKSFHLNHTKAALAVSQGSKLIPVSNLWQVCLRNFLQSWPVFHAVHADGDAATTMPHCETGVLMVMGRVKFAPHVAFPTMAKFSLIWPENLLPFVWNSKMCCHPPQKWFYGPIPLHYWNVKQNIC